MRQLINGMMKKTHFIQSFTKLLLLVNVFIIETMFRQRAFTDKSMDTQVLLKTTVWVITFAFCMACFRLWGKKLLRVDNIFLSLLLVMITASCFYAPNAFYSLGASFSLIAVIALLLMASSVLDNQAIIRQLINGCTLVMAISLLVYCFYPEFGRMKEWVGSRLTVTSRMTGITGAANTVGYISALCLIMLFYYRNYVLRPLPLGYWVAVAINLASLALSNSRTAMVAMLIALLAARLRNIDFARYAALCFGICALIAGFLLLDLEWVLARIARSGEASEITSGTGRTAIWAVTLELIAQRPFLGWGYSASTYLLPAHAGDIGFMVNQTHNAFLQVALSIGVVGLAVFIALMGVKFYYAVKSQEPLNLALIVFLLVDGITEPIAFQGVATTTTLALATVLALNYRLKHEAPDPASQQRLSRPAAA